jgi:hypothetical protein
MVSGDRPVRPPRASWRSLAILALVILLVFDVALPYALQWWAQETLRVYGKADVAQAMNAAFQVAVLLRAIIPLQIIGAIAALVCAGIAVMRFAQRAR